MTNNNKNSYANFEMKSVNLSSVRLRMLQDWMHGPGSFLKGCRVSILAISRGACLGELYT